MQTLHNLRKQSHVDFIIFSTTQNRVNTWRCLNRVLPIQSPPIYTEHLTYIAHLRFKAILQSNKTHFSNQLIILIEHFLKEKRFQVLSKLRKDLFDRSENVGSFHCRPLGQQPQRWPGQPFPDSCPLCSPLMWTNSDVNDFSNWSVGKIGSDRYEKALLLRTLCIRTPTLGNRLLTSSM